MRAVPRRVVPPRRTEFRCLSIRSKFVSMYVRGERVLLDTRTNPRRALRSHTRYFSFISVSKLTGRTYFCI